MKHSNDSKCWIYFFSFWNCILGEQIKIGSYTFMIQHTNTVTFWTQFNFNTTQCNFFTIQVFVVVHLVRRLILAFITFLLYFFFLFRVFISYLNLRVPGTYCLFWYEYVIVLVCTRYSIRLSLYVACKRVFILFFFSFISLSLSLFFCWFVCCFFFFLFFFSWL